MRGVSTAYISLKRREGNMKKEHEHEYCRMQIRRELQHRVRMISVREEVEIRQWISNAIEKALQAEGV